MMAGRCKPHLWRVFVLVILMSLARILTASAQLTETETVTEGNTSKDLTKMKWRKAQCVVLYGASRSARFFGSLFLVSNSEYFFCVSIVMANRMIYFTLGLYLLICCYTHNAMAADSDPLQDFCVADKQSKVFVNGFVCKDPKAVSADDFFFAGLGKPGNTTNAIGSNVTAANVVQIPGLNTLGISFVRIDYAVEGINPPHTYPRATEVLFVIEGTLLVGFIDTTNKFFSKTLEKGDVFVFPKGLVHFQQNVGKENAVVIAALSSQLPGVQVIANSLFAAKPPIPDSVLSKAFRISQKLVDLIKAKFAWDQVCAVYVIKQRGKDVGGLPVANLCS